MKSLNEVRLIGNVGSEPTIQFTLAGHKVARFSLATEEQWRDVVSGELRKKTAWHSVVARKKVADVAEKYCTRGNLLFVGGKLETQEYTDAEGNRRMATQVVADEIIALNATERLTKSNDADDDQLPF